MPPVIISAAITSVYRVIAVWIPVTSVPTSSATVAIATFITDVSSVMRNCPAARVSSTIGMAGSMTRRPAAAHHPKRRMWVRAGGRRRSVVAVERGRDEFRKRLLAESLSDRFGVALLAGDAEAAEEVAREALELTLGESMLYELVVGPAMHRIGRLWAAGEIGVAHEHLATQITTRVLVLAHETVGLAEHRAEHRAMLAAVEGEQHVLALDMAAKLLESAGYEVLALGADVPTSALPGIVAEHQPTLFALSATMPELSTHVPAAMDAVAEASDDIGFILGGAGVPPGLALGPRVVVERSVAGIVDAADGLVRRADLN